MTSRTLTAKYARGASLFLSSSTALLMLFLSFDPQKKISEKPEPLGMRKMDYIEKNASAAEVNIAFIELPTPPAQLQKNPKSPFYQKANKSPVAARNPSALVPKSNVTPHEKIKPRSESLKQIEASNIQHKFKPLSAGDFKPSTASTFKPLTANKPKKIKPEPTKIEKLSTRNIERDVQTPLARIIKPTAFANGGVLLSMMENGKGPDINIGWPNDSEGRNELFKTLRRCYGLQVLLVDKNNKLYRLVDRPGRSYSPDLSRTSGLARQVNGEISNAEKKLLRDIQSHHSLVKGMRPMRLFPRNFDRRLLAGFSEMGNSDLNRIKTLTARFRLQGTSLFVEKIRINERDLPESFDLSSASICRRR